MTPPSLKHCVAICGVAIAALIGVKMVRARQASRMLSFRDEAQRLMQHFCTQPTRQNYTAVWASMKAHGVYLWELDMLLVRRFITGYMEMPDARYPSP